MDGSPLKCPLCCNETFTSKESLLEHLSSVSSNLLCPICNIELPLENLMNHLVQNECQEQHTLQESFFQEITGTEKAGVDLEEKVDLKEEILPHISDEDGNNKLYVELLSKQLMKPCLQTQELKLVKEDGESRYLILTNEDLKAGNDGTTIVTKQNSDGTISMTTIKNLKIESEPALALPDPGPAVPEPEDSQDELLYSCNTCGVSFNSVVDHIRNYHNDQEVVVEEPLDSAEDMNNLLEMDNIEPDQILATEKQKRHIITETGDIVEADLFEGDNINNIQDKADEKEEIQLQTQTQLLLPKKEEPVKRTRNYTKRFVQIDKFCDSVVKDIKEDKSQGPFHKVIVKEVAPIEGGDKIKVYNCMSCNVYVTNLDEFKEYPCKTLKYPCPHCSVSYENAKSLCAHMKVHKGNTDNNLLRHICDVCSTVFRSHKSLKLHKRMHDPVKSRPIEFPVDQGNGDKANNHFICTVCDKLIPMDYLVVHQNSHKTDNKFNCDICNKKFDDSKYLAMHMTVHSTEKTRVNNPDKELPYACVYCSRQFARPHEKVKHERIHTGEKPHSCEICGKSFRVSYCLTLHMRTHTGARPYACPHCQKRFKAHSVYNHHLLTHSDVRAYKCPYCPKAFKTSVQLAGHKNSHTKPFSCQHCNRPFASLYAVRVHTETHARQNNLKFSCSLCGASYARSFALKDHIKQVHKQELVKVANEDWTNFDSQEEEKSPDTQSLEKSLPIEMDDLDIATTDTESVITGS